MTRKTHKDYEGEYIIRRIPGIMKSHNAITWHKIEKLTSTKSDGHMSFDELVTLARDHEHGTKSATKPYQFITYCIRREWLQRTAN
jgi:hypothetical protein